MSYDSVALRSEVVNKLKLYKEKLNLNSKSATVLFLIDFYEKNKPIKMEEIV